MVSNQELSATMEDYLLAAYSLEREKRVARPRDIGRRQNVAKSTVTSALQSLAGKGLINYEPYEAVTLTEEGRKHAETLILRNLVLRDFLSSVLELPPNEVGSTACGMEHALTKETVERLVCFMAFLKHRMRSDPGWFEECSDCMQRGIAGEGSEERVKKYLSLLLTPSAL